MARRVGARGRERGDPRGGVQGARRRVDGEPDSVATLVALLGLYFRVLQRRWPLATTKGALETGGAWVVLTILFEFGFGHYVAGDSWSELLENYDVTEGELWVLVLLWIGVGPAVARTAARALQP